MAIPGTYSQIPDQIALPGPLNGVAPPAADGARSGHARPAAPAAPPTRPALAEQAATAATRAATVTAV